MKKKYIILGAVVLAIIFVIVAATRYSSTKLPINTATPPLIRLGLSTQPSNGLLWVAVDKNLFAAEGLDVETKEFTAGKLALQALQGGSLDIGAAAEMPVTLASLNGQKLSIFTQVNETRGGFPMLLYKDGNKFDSATYFSKKRKIGTIIGGGPEYFTNDFFQKYHINPSQYEIVGMKPEDLPIALTKHSVDGIAIFEPFTHFALKQAGADNLFAIYDNNLYSETIVMMSKTNWAQTHQTELVNFIRALQKSYNYIKQNPDDAMAIISKHTGLDMDTLKSIWASFTFELGLKNKLMTTMQAEEQWARATGKVKPDAAPLNFQQIFYLEPLKMVTTSSVEL